MVGVTVYVEGGGNRRKQQSDLRRAFTQFIEKAGLGGRIPKVVACGGRDDTYKDFRSSHDSRTVIALLLVDSEDPVTTTSAWQHLSIRDPSWERPSDSSDDQFHLMVQVMESWFLADRAALADYYGAGLRLTAIPQWQDIERVRKSDVYDKLNKATRRTGKGRYDKGQHGFEILRRLNPDKVVNASPYAKRFIDNLKKFSSSS